MNEDKPLYFGPANGEYLESDSVAFFQNRDGSESPLPVFILRGTNPEEYYVRQGTQFARIDSNAENFLRFEKKIKGASTLHEEIHNAEKEFAAALDQQHRNRHLEAGPPNEYNRKMREAWDAAKRRY
jgi:hypothetical protein